LGLTSLVMDDNGDGNGASVISEMRYTACSTPLRFGDGVAPHSLSSWDWQAETLIPGAGNPKAWDTINAGWHGQVRVCAEQSTQVQ